MPTHAPHNHLLDALTVEEKDRLFPHLEWVPLGLSEVLYETNEKQHCVYFPTSAVISLLYVTEDGASAEISMVGSEGMVGIAQLTSDGTSPNRAVVHSAGHAYRIKGYLLKREFARKGRLHDMLLRYSQTLFAQSAQTAMCNRFHTVDQQLCRWLLLSFDRLGSDEMIMTQELIANMLGVRPLRPLQQVTATARRLGEANLDERIGYSGADDEVAELAGTFDEMLDRLRLEKNCCECYQAVKQQSAALLDMSKLDQLDMTQQ